MTTQRVEGFKHGRVPRAVREAQLLDCAEALFVEHGFDGVSMEDICRAAGVSRPVLYEHFGSKPAIYLGCIRRIRDEFDGALIESATAGADLPSAIRLAAEAFFATIEREPRRWSLVYGSSTGMVGVMADDLSQLRAATVARIADVITAHRPDGDPRRTTMAANMISGAGEQLGRWWLRNPDVSWAELVDEFSAYSRGALNEL